MTLAFHSLPRVTRRIAAMALLACTAPFTSPAWAQTKEVTFAYQDMLVPLRTIIESGELEKSTGYKIHWRQFGGGGDVIRALSSGDVQIGEAGSSPIAAATSQGQDIRLFWILDDIADAEALVAREGSGIETWKDLKGKKVATPFVSTAHYQLLVGLELEGVAPKSVQIVNLRPQEIAAAWERGDIDATFVWDPALARAKASGKVIATSGSIGKKGHPTFDGLVVNARWAAENEGFLIALVQALAKADEDYRKNGKGWTAETPQLKAIAKWSKADPAAVPAAIALYRFPTPEEQLSATWLGGGAARALANTASFLKEQGRVQEVNADYGAFVTTTYVKKAFAP